MFRAPNFEEVTSNLMSFPHSTPRNHFIWCLWLTVGCNMLLSTSLVQTFPPQSRLDGVLWVIAYTFVWTYSFLIDSTSELIDNTLMEAQLYEMDVCNRTEIKSTVDAENYFSRISDLNDTFDTLTDTLGPTMMVRVAGCTMLMAIYGGYFIASLMRTSETPRYLFAPAYAILLGVQFLRLHSITSYGEEFRKRAGEIRLKLFEVEKQSTARLSDIDKMEAVFEEIRGLRLKGFGTINRSSLTTSLKVLASCIFVVVQGEMKMLDSRS